MKKNKIFQLMLFMLGCFSLTNAQGNWELLIPTPTSNQMVGLYFIDDNVGWSVGEFGTILKTTDGGENWSIKEIPWLFDLSDVYFPTTETGYAVGTDGFIIKSSDGGESWQQLNNQYVNNINRVLFKDENIGWVICENGVILYTDDGGEIWEQQNSHCHWDLLGIDNIGEDGLCVVGMENSILITHNNGEEWQFVQYDTTEQCDFYDVYFQDDQYGWIGGSGRLLKTSDSGTTWLYQAINEVEYKDQLGRSVNSPISIPQIYFYEDQETGIALFQSKSGCLNNVPLQTTTSGYKWSSYYYGMDEHSPTDGRFCVLSEDRIISTGFAGEFRYSDDKGQSWHFLNQNVRGWRNFVVCDHGTLISPIYQIKEDAKDGNFPYKTILKSTDYGSTWQTYTQQLFNKNGQLVVRSPDPPFPLGSFIDNRDTLWSVDSWDPKVIMSTDFGLTYHIVHGELDIIGSAFWPDIVFLTRDTLIYYSIEPAEIAPDQFKPELVFHYSYDCGRNFTEVRNRDIWNNISPVKEETINDHCFFDSHLGFLVGQDGNIIRTADTGQNWENIYSGVVEELWDIEFISETTGFVAGDFGRILKTDDGGDTWRKTESGTQENVYCISFKNELEGWAGTENGMRYTTDGGETWLGVPLRYAHGKIRNIKFDSNGNGYAYTYPAVSYYGDNERLLNESGTYGYLLRLYSEDVAVDDKYIQIAEPTKLSLAQNYPNPFNSRTTIEYHLSQQAEVKLKIFDIQGRLVRTLINRVQESGSHLAIWDGASDSGLQVSSGIYVYQLECGDQVKRQKLLLLK